MADDLRTLGQMIGKETEPVLRRWLDVLNTVPVTGGGRVAENELRTQCREFLAAVAAGFDAGAAAATDEAFAPARALLERVSRTRAAQGFTPRETATFVFSLKEPLFDLLRTADDGRPAMGASWQMSTLLDQLGLHTMESYTRSREELIRRQQDEIAELSTPVVKLWDGILALPLIGTLDSSRTQVVMESLLEAIVAQGAGIAIIDITGVPTVDTQVAQHLLKTVAAARLMGADCIVSGIRPQIAQTMVHLGVELTVVSKATLADALALALHRTGRAVVRQHGDTPGRKHAATPAHAAG